MANNAEIEAIFFRVLDDLQEYLSDLTLVGGWLSYVHPKFLWDNLSVNPVTTVDVDREDELKKAKDLFYIYFVLRYAPDAEAILKEVHQFVKAGHLPRAEGNLRKYFQRKSSQGCLMVEKENGPDGFIEDLRGDIFERFAALRAQLV